MRNRVPQLVRRVNDLPTLPAIYHEVEQVTRDSSVSSSRVAQVIGKDPVLAARLLRVVNSNHARLGRLLAKRWRLPEPYPDVIAYHHEPASAPPPSTLCQAFHVADVLAQALELEGPSLRRVATLRPEGWEGLRLSTDSLPSLLDLTQVSFSENLEVFPMLLPDGGDAEEKPRARACSSHS